MKKLVVCVSLLFVGCSTPKPIQVEPVKVLPVQVEIKPKEEEWTDAKKARRLERLESQERLLRARQEMGFDY